MQNSHLSFTTSYSDAMRDLLGELRAEGAGTDLHQQGELSNLWQHARATEAPSTGPQSVKV